MTLRLISASSWTKPKLKGDYMQDRVRALVATRERKVNYGPCDVDWPHRKAKTYKASEYHALFDVAVQLAKALEVAERALTQALKSQKDGPNA